jgi:hypothetical protein
MSEATVTIRGMKKRKPSGKKPDQPRGRSPSEAIFVRINPGLGKALESYMNGVRPKTTRTAVIEAALEEFLAARGHWPPSEGGAR